MRKIFLRQHLPPFLKLCRCKFEMNDVKFLEKKRQIKDAPEWVPALLVKARETNAKNVANEKRDGGQNLDA